MKKSIIYFFMFCFKYANSQDIKFSLNSLKDSTQIGVYIKYFDRTSDTKNELKLKNISSNVEIELVNKNNSTDICFIEITRKKKHFFGEYLIDSKNINQFVLTEDKNDNIIIKPTYLLAVEYNNFTQKVDSINKLLKTEYKLANKDDYANYHDLLKKSFHKLSKEIIKSNSAEFSNFALLELSYLPDENHRTILKNEMIDLYQYCIANFNNGLELKEAFDVIKYYYKL